MCKEQFVEAYKKFPPSKYELFFLKNVSFHSIKDNIFPAMVILIALLLPFIFEIICCSLEMPYICKLIPTLIYSFILFVFGVLWGLLMIKKYKRFEKIRKYLGVSKEDYKGLIAGYYKSRYPSTEKYIKYNAK